MGVVGLETAFPVLYTYLVKRGVEPQDLVERMSGAARSSGCRTASRRAEADLAVFDLDRMRDRPGDVLLHGAGHAVRGLAGQGRMH